ncbi:olfactory receptor 6F1-like [Rhinatrema bivittatum]|uniref:olfactory receptor 6F1-like n=1 Tax=Rhinatrema bivittatum TaxID=194408 RepID=UPI0011269D01|nr:olfactory receptor 6F1-like [Rhinatrema bivittatum]
MESENQTTVTTFILLGFSSFPELKILLFLLFGSVYILTIIGNITIIAVIKNDSHLHTPMYFFLTNFSFLEICYTSNIVPKMLYDILTENRSVSLLACIMQLYFFGSLGSTECFLLGVMAYDRYLAICHPLHYRTLMNNRACLQLAASSWLSGFLATLIAVSLFSQLHFCGPNKIKHFFCDLQPVLKLSCTDTFLPETIAGTFASIILLGSCLLTIGSYVQIISTILRIPSSEGRQKAFSTCISHLTVVLIFYGAMIFMYVKPVTISSFDFNKILAVLYTVVTPVLNPFIYTLRNKDVKKALTKAAHCRATQLGGITITVNPH